MNQSQKLTHQGVRDLNGPNANGRGYNGRMSASCPHRRAPDAVAAEMRLEDRLVSGVVRRVAVYYCASCGEKRWEEGEPGVELV